MATPKNTNNSKKKHSLTTDDVKHIANLANIQLTDAEIEKFRRQLSMILEYVDKLSEVDTSGVEITSHTELKNVLREDEAEESLTQDEALSNRKDDSKGGAFTVKSIFGENS